MEAKKAKTYFIPYDDQAKRWEQLEFQARVIDPKTGKVQKLKPPVLLEDPEQVAYPAFANNVLVVESTQIESRIEAGDHARIILRLNDDDPKIGQILKQHDEFRVKLTLYPDMESEKSDVEQTPLPVEGFTTITIQKPQTWDLTFKKTFWLDDGSIDLKKVETISALDLQSLGDQGGRLILRPMGLFVAENLNERVRSTIPIAQAGACSLDRGQERIVPGEWDPGLEAYVFEIEADQAEPEAPFGDLNAEVEIGMHQGYQRRLTELLQAAKALSGTLGGGIPDRARDFIQGFLDLIAREPEELLVERKEDLSKWLLNIPRFIEFTRQALTLFDKALALFDEAFNRFVGNMINFSIELVFFLFDWIKAVKNAGSAKEAVEGATKEMVEETAEQATRQLAARKELVERGLKAAEEEFSELTGRIGSMLNDPPPQISPAWAAQLRTLRQQQLEAAGRLTTQSKELADIQANQTMANFIRENSADFSSESFIDKVKRQAQRIPESPEVQAAIRHLEALESQDVGRLTEWGNAIRQTLDDLPADASAEARIELNRLLSYIGEHRHAFQLDALKSFDENAVTDMLVKGPYGEKMQKVRQQAEAAKKSAEELRYKHVPFQYYEGWLAPLWFMMDWAWEQVVWLYDLAKEWIPGVAQLESLLIWAIELFLQTMTAIINAMIDYMNSHTWVRSSIAVEVRSRGVQQAQSNGASSQFFAFPKAVDQLVQRCKPMEVVDLGSSGGQGEMQAAKSQLRSHAEGGYGREKSDQQRWCKAAFTQLCEGALDISHLDGPAPELISAGQANAVWKRMLGPMQQYETAFKSSSASGTDYITGVPARFMENSTFQDWDGAIEWLAWTTAWILRLGSLAAVGTGYGAAFVVPAFAGASAIEQAAALLRPAVSWLGTMPDVIGLQFDVLIATALMYLALLEGGVNVDEMIVEGYYVSE